MMKQIATKREAPESPGTGGGLAPETQQAQAATPSTAPQLDSSRAPENSSAESSSTTETSNWRKFIKRTDKSLPLTLPLAGCSVSILFNILTPELGAALGYGVAATAKWIKHSVQKHHLESHLKSSEESLHADQQQNRQLIAAQDEQIRGASETIKLAMRENQRLQNHIGFFATATRETAQGGEIDGINFRKLATEAIKELGPESDPGLVQRKVAQMVAEQREIVRKTGASTITPGFTAEQLSELDSIRTFCVIQHELVAARKEIEKQDEIKRLQKTIDLERQLIATFGQAGLSGERAQSDAARFSGPVDFADHLTERLKVAVIGDKLAKGVSRENAVLTADELELINVAADNCARRVYHLAAQIAKSPERGKQAASPEAREDKRPT